MLNNAYETGKGKKLVDAMMSGKIKKDNRPNHGNVFSGGYEYLYYTKFQTYLGTVSRVLMNRELEEKQYDGE